MQSLIHLGLRGRRDVELSCNRFRHEGLLVRRQTCNQVLARTFRRIHARLQLVEQVRFSGFLRGRQFRHRHSMSVRTMQAGDGCLSAFRSKRKRSQQPIEITKRVALRIAHIQRRVKWPMWAIDPMHSTDASIPSRDHTWSRAYRRIVQTDDATRADDRISGPRPTLVRQIVSTLQHHEPTELNTLTGRDQAFVCDGRDECVGRHRCSFEQV